MVYICDYCGGMFDHEPIPVSKKTACPFCKRESYSRTDMRTRRYEEMPTLRAASEKEIKYFKSDSYSPPEILPDDEWEDGTDFIDDYEPFWDERGEEEEENLQEPLYKVRFSDDYLVEVTLTFVSVTSLAFFMRTWLRRIGSNPCNGCDFKNISARYADDAI